MTPSTSKARADLKGTLGLVVPLANEEETIDGLLTRIEKQLCSGDTIFCVLDNASKDRTREIVGRRAAADSRIKVIFAPENRNVVDAYFRGYEEAIAAGCDWIIEMDGGLSHLPEEIPRILRGMLGGYDFVAGSRFCRGGVYVGRGSRYFISRFGSLLVNVVLGTTMKDMTSGFQGFSRESLELVLDRGVRSRAHFFQTEIRYMLKDWKWIEVPITYSNPSSGVGTQSIVEALRVLSQLRREQSKDISYD